MSAILVVDVSEAGRTSTTALLSQAGYSVLAAANGEEALKLADGSLAVVLDTELPDVDGFQLCRILKSHPSTLDLPIVHFTASRAGDVQSHIKSLELGADAYLAKPVVPEVLLATLRALILARQAKVELTAARERLALSERMMTVGTLAAGVAHEVNNPLATVLANVEFALERLAQAKTGPDAKTVKDVTEALVDARDGTERVRRVVENLQIFSRNRVDAEGPIDVRELARNTLRMAKAELRYRCQVVEHYDDVPEVTANEHRLSQIILGLLMNAAHAIAPGQTDKNEIRLSVTADAEHVTLEIRDTGGGISPDVAAHIFDPFFTTNTVGQGMGMGLSIARHLVDSMHGSIHAESEIGKGTAMRVRLPIARRQPAPPDAQKAAAVTQPSVLVVDDDAAISSVLQRVLGGQSRLTVLRDATEALERIRGGERFDAILCDVMMPNVTGPEFATLLSAVSQSQSARLGFMTGGVVGDSLEQKLVNLGRPVLKKPFTPSEVREFVQTLAQSA